MVSMAGWSRSSIIHRRIMRVRFRNLDNVNWRGRRRSGVARIEVLALLCCVGVAGIMVGACDGSKSAGRIEADRKQCLANLKNIAEALAAYHQANDQRWPYIEMLKSAPMHDPPWSSLADALKPSLADPAKSLHCPADVRTLEDGSPLLAKFSRKTTWFETEGTSYEWSFAAAYGGRRVGEEEFGKLMRLGRADQPLLRDFDTFHAGDDAGSFNTLNADLKPRTSREARKGRN